MKVGKRSDVMIIGDVHGDFGKLNSLINSKKPKMILQCGDWGFWPRYQGASVRHFGRKILWDNYAVENKDTIIYWCPGNHEDWWSLDKLTDNEIQPNIFYMKRGSVLTLPDGRNVLFMGGANSVDKNMRTIGDDWFPQEVITQKDIYDLPDVNVDIVVSHTCPEEFFTFNHAYIDDRDPSRKALSYVLEKYRPTLWYFGHFHQYQTGYKSRCNWTALNHSQGNTGWWVWLE